MTELDELETATRPYALRKSFILEARKQRRANMAADAWLHTEGIGSQSARYFKSLLMGSLGNKVDYSRHTCP